MEIKIMPPFIKLEQFLKLSNIASSGGDAKTLIATGNVLVNGEQCLMRGKKLKGDDIVTIKDNNEQYIAKMTD